MKTGIDHGILVPRIALISTSGVLSVSTSVSKHVVAGLRPPPMLHPRGFVKRGYALRLYPPQTGVCSRFYASMPPDGVIA